MAYSEPTKNFFENLRILRRKHNLTIEEMASRLGIRAEELQLLEESIFPNTISLTFLENLYTEFGTPSIRLFQSQNERLPLEGKLSAIAD